MSTNLTSPRIIHHLIVGNENFCPRPEDLEEAIREFAKNIPCFRMPVKVRTIGSMLASRLVLSAWSPEWTPTEEESQGLISMFENALQQTAVGNPVVVATRWGVNAEFV